jgi:hypothetical protein
LRKTLFGVALLAALAVPATALANPPVVTSDVKITPSTKSKPGKFTFKVVNSADSKTTMSGLKLALPAGVKLDGKQLKACNLAILENGAPSDCPAATKLGTGVAYASLVTPAAAPNCVATPGASGCLTFKTYFFVGGPRQLNVYLEQTNGDIKQAFAGKMSANGRTLTIAIPDNLQRPAPGLYSALQQLSGSFSKGAKSGGKLHSFVTTSKKGSGKVSTTLTYATNTAGVAPAPMTVATPVAWH